MEVILEGGVLVVEAMSEDDGTDVVGDGHLSQVSQVHGRALSIHPKD